MTKTDDEIKPMNYNALEYLGWFRSDSQSLGNWCSQLFGSEVNLNSSRVAELKAAAENSLKELEDDVKNIRIYLDEYVPVNNGDKK